MLEWMNDMMIAFHLHTMSCFPPKIARERRVLVAVMWDGDGGVCGFVEGDIRFKYRYVDIVCVLVQENS